MLPLIPSPGAESLAPGDEVTVAARILGPLLRDEGPVVLGAMGALTELAVGRDGGRLELVSRTLARERVIGLDAAAADPDHTALAKSASHGDDRRPTVAVARNGGPAQRAVGHEPLGLPLVA